MFLKLIDVFFLLSGSVSARSQVKRVIHLGREESGQVRYSSWPRGVESSALFICGREELFATHFLVSSTLLWKNKSF